MSRNKYDTKQRKTIMAYLMQNSDKHLTAEMIAGALSDCVGQTTVYRNLDWLVKEHVVIKVDMPNGKGAYYQYLNEPSSQKSCHLLCSGCGEVVNLSCSFISELSSHVDQEHRFKLDNTKTVLRGLCEHCVQ